MTSQWSVWYAECFRQGAVRTRNASFSDPGSKAHFMFHRSACGALIQAHDGWQKAYQFVQPDVLSQHCNGNLELVDAGRKREMGKQPSLIQLCTGPWGRVTQIWYLIAHMQTKLTSVCLRLRVAVVDPEGSYALQYLLACLLHAISARWCYVMCLYTT